MLTVKSGRVREARKLTRRAGREKAGLFLAEGAQAVREAVGTGRAGVVEVFATPAARVRHAPIVEAAQAAGIQVSIADDEALAALSETVTPQGLVAVCRPVVDEADVVVAASAALIAVLVEAQDPGNVGTVIRCADAAGADAVLVTYGSVDVHSGKAVRASAGSVFHLPIGAGASVEDVVGLLHRRGLTVIAADGAGGLDLDEAEHAGLLARPTAWLFGNEARGLPESVRTLADHVVRVPIYGRAESLNLATAAAVCLYASARVHARQPTG